MYQLIDGRWQTAAFQPVREQGRYARPASRFRDWVTADGGRFPAEAGRYRLYVSYACPWAHRTLIVRALKGLQDVVPVSVVHPLMLDQGWVFDPSFAGSTADDAEGMRCLHQLYTLADPHYTGLVTVPMLWDCRQRTIVNNESSEILRMFNSAFAAWSSNDPDLYPEAWRAEIDAWNADIYEHVNNGVYRCGFAATQEAYEQAFDALFAMLDRLERHLAGHDWLVGGRMTEADWRLYTTLVRFDAVYHGHFKCNLHRLTDLPALWAYVRRLHAVPGVAGLLRLDHIKHHYYGSHPGLNPSGIVPKGPLLDFGV